MLLHLFLFLQSQGNQVTWSCRQSHTLDLAPDALMVSIHGATLSSCFLEAGAHPGDLIRFRFLFCSEGVDCEIYSGCSKPPVASLRDQEGLLHPVSMLGLLGGGALEVPASFPPRKSSSLILAFDFGSGRPA